MSDYNIYIRKETADTRSPIAGDGTAPSGTSGSGGSGRGSTLVKPLIAYNHYIKPFANQIVNQRVSTVELRTGAQEYEQRLSYQIQVAEKVGGFVSSVLIGGALGNLPGAIIGGAMSVATTALDIMGKYNRLELERNVEDVGLHYVNMRAGGSLASYIQSRKHNQ